MRLRLFPLLQLRPKFPPRLSRRWQVVDDSFLSLKCKFDFFKLISLDATDTIFEEEFETKLFRVPQARYKVNVNSILTYADVNSNFSVLDSFAQDTKNITISLPFQQDI